MNTEINKQSIDCVDFPNIDSLLLYLIDRVRFVQDDDYESVKLYGSGKLMLEILKRVLSLDRYDFIRVGCIDYCGVWYDENVIDDYVLELNSDYELSFQSAWNDIILFENEAKYTICMDYCRDSIIENVLKNNTPVIIAKIN